MYTRDIFTCDVMASATIWLAYYLTVYLFIYVFFEDSEASQKLLREQGVLPYEVLCKLYNLPCTLWNSGWFSSHWQKISAVIWKPLWLSHSHKPLQYQCWFQWTLFCLGMFYSLLEVIIFTVLHIRSVEFSCTKDTWEHLMPSLSNALSCHEYTKDSLFS